MSKFAEYRGFATKSDSLISCVDAHVILFSGLAGVPDWYQGLDVIRLRIMFGIVIWYSADSGRGLVWCEDQKELAEFDREALDSDLLGMVAVNDQILFDEARVIGIRRVTRINEHWPGSSLYTAGADIVSRLRSRR